MNIDKDVWPQQQTKGSSTRSSLMKCMQAAINFFLSIFHLPAHQLQIQHSIRQEVLNTEA